MYLRVPEMMMYPSILALYTFNCGLFVFSFAIWSHEETKYQHIFLWVEKKRLCVVEFLAKR